MLRDVIMNGRPLYSHGCLARTKIMPRRHRAARALRQRYSLLTMCKTPELAAQVTLQPIQRLPVDAAIIFTDLLIPLEPMGVKLVFAPNEGPVIENPVRGAADVEALRTFDPETDLAFTLEAIRM